ncbi:5-formyltetrahydrofolate cyclo-ligase [Sulfuriroseicoccus oceanibius]|uniref:5-formyltetrahydrofolate cyclo-ligase n=1 Tax=Sulfuriroseicoccus oceanibius TaxID=2707525 RepID=A0A6B3L8J3_9BACT|nr:5-formyltetrahydrofolate cyclo-ligase [Sulfuriroseicoccus oceanibius]QQL44259.1 5-formyltetrahydrofolate cyclo-ligase [Sulfuriroseicoccus oceanibius]
MNEKMAHPTDIRNSKALLRREIKSRLAGTTDAELERQDGEIACQIVGILNTAQTAQTVLMFSPIRFEPQIASAFDHCLNGGHQLVLPRITDAASGAMNLLRVDALDTMVNGPFGITEPDPDFCPPVDAGSIDLAFIPGWAFNPQSGARLGKGGGFYDRLLANPNFRARTIGVAYSDQLVPDLPIEAHDHPMDAVLSPEGLVEVEK